MKLTPEFLADPINCNLLDAYVSLQMLLTGQHGDADPAHLIRVAADALRDALEGMEAVKSA